MRATAVPDDCVITLSAADVSKTFTQVNIHKVAGPDGLPGPILGACADQLASVFTDIFNLSLNESVIPTCCKQTTIIPVTKKVTCLNACRPIALTSVAMKCFERRGCDGSHHRHYPGNPRPTPICISPQQIHRWCKLYCTTHCPFTPGQKEHLCENTIHWLQLSVQHHSALKAYH